MDTKHILDFVFSPVSMGLPLLKCSEGKGTNFRPEPGGGGRSRVIDCLRASTADSKHVSAPNREKATG